MKILVLVLFIALGLISCQDADYSPKPRSFHRIEFPNKEYVLAQLGYPFSFEIPIYANLAEDLNTPSEICWKNIDFKQFNAKLHLSYVQIDQNTPLAKLTEDARTFVFKHTTKAVSIDQRTIYDPLNRIYGLEYYIQGNTASNYQFYVSDSTTHYLRGALYFNEKPNLDSIQPVLNFLKTDIEHLISTIRWK